MHEACYRMLEIRRGPPSHTPVNNERLYAYLLREFKKLTMSAYGLEYVRGLSSDWDVEEEVARFGGAERFWDDVWDDVRGYEYLVCDPLDLELRLPPPFPPPPPKEEENEQAKKSEETKDPLFATLPPEVILQVLTHLTLRELDNLRTASPVIARVRLSEEGFWRKRLEAMPWAWEIQEQEVVQKWGYEGACRALGAVEVDGRGNLADGSGVPLGVRNRVRIWRCLGSVIAGLDEEEVEDEEDEYDGY
ncbi:hypothetical protein L873DRAFT_1803064 [Choiromyces venosus 120613-1]|uniref:F-box domain-containing protein n=1 Tax=Choiromyces venosus 120613-1 TaxID=1336337 RepID=A0A3N4JXQ6_9PEZI|nr:hypothetical protein L873DRAFT_1803064 [Choiromyces venosus 120613-1]